MTIITKAALAAELGISKGRVSQYCAQGLPVRPDGKLNREDALDWVRNHISAAQHYGKGAAVALGAKRSRPPQKSAPLSVDEPAVVSPAANGYTADELRLLSGIRARWPGVIRRAVLLYGGDERAAALAVAAVMECTDHLAASLFDESNPDGVTDCTAVLPEADPLPWSADAVELIASIRHAIPNWVDTDDGRQLACDMLEVVQSLE